MRAKAVRFYGFSDKELDKMPYKRFMEYYKCIDILSSEETLKGYKIGIFPNLKKQAQEKEWKDLQNNIKYSIKKDKGQKRSLKDIAIDLSRKMING